MSRSHLEVRKTYKLYIGGKFVRGESGRSISATSGSGKHLDNFSPASRKDFRDAAVGARSAVAGWAGKTTPYLRGQILYRAAEMLQGRSAELVREIERSTGARAKARAEVQLAIDRLVYYAGWTDKCCQVFGSVNPVATPHFNFTLPEATGVVVALAPDEPVLVSLVSLLAPVILTGNTVILLASERHPLPALTFCEILATSDLPGGVVNVLAGQRAELAPHIAGHMDINAIVDASGVPEIRSTLQGGAGANLKRCIQRHLSPAQWFSEKAEDPYWILDTIEFKTAWHPIGL